MGSPIPQSLPSAECRRLIETYAGLISDPAQKLRFLNGVLRKYEETSRLYKSSITFQETVLTQIVLAQLKALRPDASPKVRELIRSGKVPAPSGIRWHMYRFRHAILSLVALVLVLALGSAVASLKRNDLEVDLMIEMPVSTLVDVLRAEDPGQTVVSEKGTVSSAVMENHPVSAAEEGKDVGNQDPVKTEGHSNGFKQHVEVFRPEFATVMPGADVLSVAQDRIIGESGGDEYLDKAIWLVEEGPESELYSNGLQILTDHTVQNEPRGYYRFPRDTDGLPSRKDVTDKIVGILYHAAESDMIDFKPEENDSLNRYSKALVRYIQKNKSYNYFIDRFGRVYRIVREDHAAYHAGWSVWADKEWAYLNLNHAFLGICFEGKDFYQSEVKADRAQVSPMGGSMINEGQLTSGKKLTDWLRVKYRIGQHNCVTHGLASINPHKMLIGYHLDLARGFPFERFGLKDKTKVQLPAVTDFGFRYDDHFIQVFDGHLWDGIAYSEDYLRHHAEMAGMSEPEYRQVLANRFSRWFKLYQDLHG